jgi:hypothetical protein
MSEVKIAHDRAPASEPAKRALRRPVATLRCRRSIVLVSISTRPSLRKTHSPSQWFRA